MIEAHLRPGERLLWSGKPARGLRLQESDWVIVPFSLLFSGISVLWFVSVLARGNVPYILFGLPFLAASAYMTLGRFVWDALLRARTAYGVTDRRVIITTNIGAPSLKQRDLARLSDVKLEEKADGRGVIVLGPRNSRTGWSASRWPLHDAAPSFVLGDKAREVYGLIQQAKAEA